MFVGVNADVGRDPVDIDDDKSGKALEGQGDGFDQRAVLDRLPLAKDAGPGPHTVSKELKVSVGVVVAR